MENDKCSVVIVGVENSGVFGKCDGSETDAYNMAKLLGQYSSDLTFLINGSATVQNVRSAFEKAVKSDLAIIYYSGHGGSQRFEDTGIEEVDGKDEFLCLYDGILRDNDIWDITGKSKGRVFEIFDCCHSETMFRVPGIKFRKVNTPIKRLTKLVSDFIGKIKKPASQEKTISLGQNLLVWSGCPDNTYSYGSSDGGKFTNTLLKHFKKELTYSQLWSLIKADQSLKRFEQVQSTKIGDFPTSNQIFS